MALAKWQAVLLLAFALLGICHAKPNLSKAVSLIDQIGGFNHRTLKTVERAKLVSRYASNRIAEGSLYT